MPVLPPSYRSLVARRTGSSFREVAHIDVRSSDALLEQLGPTDVIIAVRHAGINGGCETFRARGEHAFSGNQELINFPLGAEGVGTIAVAGPRVRGLVEGDAVAFVGGAYSELVLSRGMLCTKIPEASPDYAALTISGTTAVSALEAVGGIRPSDVVLITAAAGGTGHFAAQLAKKVHGCHVVATCGGERKAQYLASLGIDRVIDHTKEDPATVLAREYPGKITLAFEGVGGALRAAALAALSPRGRLLNVGYIAEYPHNATPDRTDAAEASGSSSDLPSAAELFWANKTVHRDGQTIFGNVWPSDRALVPKLRGRAFELYAEGLWAPLVDPACGARFQGLGAVCEATEYMLSGGSIGKVVAGISI